MFDLFRSRDKAVRILLGALLLLVALSMLTYLIPSYNTGGNAGDVVVAEIGKEVITLPDVQRLIQATMRNRQVPAEVLPNFIPQMVDNMITERALAFEAGRLGYQVTDADVALAIQGMIPNLFPDGKFAGKEAYAAMLAQQNLTIPEFENDLKRQLLAARVRDIAMEGVIVTPLEIEQEFRRRNEKIKIEYVRISSDKVRAEIQPGEPELRSYFEGNKGRYRVPEKRSLAILIADQAKMEGAVNATDADLQRAYDQNKDRFRTPDRVKVRHILLKTLGKPAADDAKMKTKAEDLLKQIKGGGDFAKLAKENSEDTGSAVKGGELPDFVTRGQTVPEFEKAAFSLNPGETSGIVKTQYGYHIIQVLSKESARLRPFDEVKTEIAAEWKKQRVNQIMQQVSDRAQSALQKDPGHPEKVAADLNMQLTQVDSVSAGDPLPEIGVSKDFEDSISSLKKGEASQPVALPSNKIAVALCTNLLPARAATFDEVKAKVREDYIASRLDPVVTERAIAFSNKLKSLNNDLAATAKSMGLELKTTEEFNRQGAVEGLTSASYLSEAFTKPVGSVAGPIGLPEGRVFVKVLNRNEGDLSQLPSQSVTIREELKRTKARERNALFEDGVRQMLMKEGKVKIHKDVLDRLRANYRG